MISHEDGKYQELIITMGELMEGDRLLCTDGEWRECKLLPIHMPKRMFLMEFQNSNGCSIGCVKCSGDHIWTLFPVADMKSPVNMQADAMHDGGFMKNSNRYWVGQNGTFLSNMQEIEPEPVRCVSLIGSHDNLFAIIPQFYDGYGSQYANMEVEMLSER